jgi:hypothetical protein
VGDYFHLTDGRQVSRIARLILFKFSLHPEAEPLHAVDDPFKSVVVEIFAALDSAMVAQDLAVLGLAKTEFFLPTWIKANFRLEIVPLTPEMFGLPSFTIGFSITV